MEFTIFEEVFNQGYPHELAHFIDCVRNDKSHDRGRWLCCPEMMLRLMNLRDGSQSDASFT